MASPNFNSRGVLQAARDELSRLREAGDGFAFSALCRKLESDRPDFMAELCLFSLDSETRRLWVEAPGLDFRPSFRWGGLSVRIQEESAVSPILKSWAATELSLRAFRLEGVDPTCLLSLIQSELLSPLRELAIEGCGLASRGSAYPVTDRILQVNLEGHEEVLASLIQLGELKVLRLADNRLGNRGLLFLRKFYHLEGLELRGNAISDAGLEALSSLSSLVRLGLGKNRIEGAGLACFSHLRALEHLDLHGNPLVDLSALPEISGLQRLNLEECAVSETELEKLKKRLPACKL